MITFLRKATVATILSLSAVTAQSKESASPTISADFPFEKSFVDVRGSQMAYVDEGVGSVVRFVLGNPTATVQSSPVTAEKSLVSTWNP